jgi:phenylacetate-coenzyme A ligase PaaK-like adenylate-forming protein
LDLRDFPFYRSRLDARGVPEPWSLDDLEDYAAAHDDPFAGRVRGGRQPAVALQIEATSEPPVWAALDPPELNAWADVVSRLWLRFGLGADETIAFFDYGSNPCVLLSSSIYVSHLRRGAATRLGAHTICNDGVASMTTRMLVILENVRPAALVVRRDLIAPLTEALATQGQRGEKSVRWAAVSEVEGAAPTKDADRLADALGVPVRRLGRADAAFFVAGDCPECGQFHLDRSYRAESIEGGEIVLSAPFVGGCPAVRYRLGRAELLPAGCPLERKAARLAW